MKSNNRSETQTVVVNGIVITPDLTDALGDLADSLEGNKTTLVDGVFYLAQMEGEVEYIDKRFFQLLGIFRDVLNAMSAKKGGTL